MSTSSAPMGAAGAGPMLEAVLVPLTGQGKLRVSYNWLYSSLNCDPSDSSDFTWVLGKDDDSHVFLSPRDQYAGATVYASVRDDLDWYVQVQAPYSADWITGVGGDETLTITGADLLTISLQGFNGQYLTVDSQLSEHDGHAGYRVRSVGDGSDYDARTFFVGVGRVLQDGLDVPLRADLSEADVARALGSSGGRVDPASVTAMYTALTTTT